MEIADIYISLAIRIQAGCNALTIMASIIDFQELLKKEGEIQKRKLPRQSKRTISIRTASNESTQGETKEYQANIPDCWKRLMGILTANP